MTKKQVAISFNRCINSQDLKGLSALMTDEHTFIDSANNSFAGKQKAVETWKDFFQLFPKYRNIFDVVEEKRDMVVMRGHSVCPSNDDLDGPAIWTAKVADEKVVEWRVYEDTKENRKKFGLN